MGRPFCVFSYSVPPGCAEASLLLARLRDAHGVSLTFMGAKLGVSPSFLPVKSSRSFGLPCPRFNLSCHQPGACGLPLERTSVQSKDSTYQPLAFASPSACSPCAGAIAPPHLGFAALPPSTDITRSSPLPQDRRIDPASDSRRQPTVLVPSSWSLTTPTAFSCSQLASLLRLATGSRLRCVSGACHLSTTRLAPS